MVHTVRTPSIPTGQQTTNERVAVKATTLRAMFCTDPRVRLRAEPADPLLDETEAMFRGHRELEGRRGENVPVKAGEPVTVRLPQPAIPLLDSLLLIESEYGLAFAFGRTSDPRHPVSAYHFGSVPIGEGSREAADSVPVRGRFASLLALRRFTYVVLSFLLTGSSARVLFWPV